MSSDYGLLDVSGIPTDEKSAEETTRVTFHWAERLDGETIAMTTYELPDGLSNVGETDSGSVQSVLVSGGDGSRIYRVTCMVDTSGGRRLRQTKRVLVRCGRTVSQPILSEESEPIYTEN